MWYYTIVLYITLNCALYYTIPSELWTLPDNHQRSPIFIAQEFDMGKRG